MHEEKKKKKGGKEQTAEYLLNFFTREMHFMLPFHKQSFGAGHSLQRRLAR